MSDNRTRNNTFARTAGAWRAVAALSQGRYDPKGEGGFPVPSRLPGRYPPVCHLDTRGASCLI